MNGNHEGGNPIDMVARVIVVGMSVVLLVSAGMQYLLLGVPFFRQIEFERICHSYAMQMDRDGGLTESVRQELRNKLENRGFEVEQISAPASAPYNQEMHLYIKARIRSSQIRADLRMEEMPLSLVYQLIILSRKTVPG